ncbi:MAG: YitT family protein [Christensenellales bacterium]
MSKETKKVFGVIIKVLLILIGTFVMGCAYNLFYASSNIVLGGFGGLSMLISSWLENIGVFIDMNIIYFALNIVFYIFAVKLLGKSFAFYTLVGILSYTVFLSVTSFVSTIEIPNDLLLCCLYGGVLTGIGVGVVVRFGGSTGGGDLLGCIANHFSRKLTVGNVSMVINLIVIVLSIFTYGIELALYAIISIYISGVITDVVIEGPKSVKAFYIISKNYVEISNAIMTELGRGVTAFYAEGMYTGNDQRVLLCIVYKHQIGRLKNIIYSIDNKAFVYSISVNDAMGKGFSTLTPSQNLLQKLTLKNNKKAIPMQNLANQSNVYTTVPTNEGVSVFEEDFKIDLNKMIDSNLQNAEISKGTDNSKVVKNSNQSNKLKGKNSKKTKVENDSANNKVEKGKGKSENNSNKNNEKKKAKGQSKSLNNKNEKLENEGKNKKQSVKKVSNKN